MLIALDYLIKKYKVKPTGVLHIGGNIGEEADAYNKAGISKVCWIEANPELIPTLKANVKKYGHRVIEACIGDMQDFEVTFHISNNSGQSSSYLELGTHRKVHPNVHYVKDIVMKTKRLDSMGCWGEYDFLNMDLQGAELKALKGMGDTLDHFKWAYLEVNWKELYIGCPLFDEVKKFMADKGFYVAEFKECGKTSWGDCFFIRK